MPKKQFSDFRVFITLTLICIGAAAILAGVYKFTEKPIADAEKRARQEALNVVLPPETENIEKQEVQIEDRIMEFHVARDKTGKIVGYAFETISDEGYGGDIVFLVGLDAEGNINTYKVMSHTETPGLGDNLTTEDFKKQFKGKNRANFTFKVTKDKGDVQSITAATISSRAACEALDRGMKYFEIYRTGKK